MTKNLTLALALSLFGSIAVFADDGNQQGGGNTNNCMDPNNCPPAVCTQVCPRPMADSGDASDDMTVFSIVEDEIVDVTIETIEYVLF